MIPKLVIFDCDGVIVDSEHITNQAIRDDLAERGLDLPLDQVMTLFVGGTMRGVAETAAEMGAEMPEDWVEQFYLKVYDVLAREVEVVPGILAVLDQLETLGIPVAIGSNGRVDKMRVTLGRVGLWDRLGPVAYSAQDCAAQKPAPDVYLKAARIAGVAPADAVVVEDSPSGARAGQAAGMRVLGFVRDTAPERMAPHCDHLFSDMSELPGLLSL